MRLKEPHPARARRALELMRWNGGGANGSGIGLANIDTQGNVHPDQFWQTVTLGNVKTRSFSDIWRDSDDVTIRGLRDRLPLLRGRCATCRWQDICGGGFRVRAWQRFGDPWQEDPCCYLTNEEIARSVAN